jgi:predicted membrane protein
VAVFGDSVLDMRGSHSADAELGVSALALFGDVEVLAPENSAVDLTGAALFGDNTSNVPAASASTASMLLRVKGLAVFGDVKVS